MEESWNPFHYHIDMQSIVRDPVQKIAQGNEAKELIQVKAQASELKSGQ